MAWQADLRAVAQQVMEARGVPGMVIGVQQGSAPSEFLTLGEDDAGVPLSAESLFPVASVAKPATALALLRLVAQGALALDDELESHLPRAALAQPGVTLRRLLCHTAGAPGDVDGRLAPYAPGLSWESIKPALLAAKPILPPGRAVFYSNAGVGLAALVVEEVTGERFHSAFRRLVLDPLGIEAYLGDEPPRTPARPRGDYGDHAGTPLEMFNTPWYRSLGFPWGGLYTTAAGALAIVGAFAGRPADFLPAWLHAEATSDQTGGVGGGFGWMDWNPCPWGLGPEVRGAKTPHWTPMQASPRTFGHVGASGVCAWHDPDADLSWAILGACMFDWWPGMAEIGAALYL